MERTIFLPFFNAPGAEELATIVTFFGLPQNLKTNAANQLVTQLLMHEAILNAVEIVSSRVMGGSQIRVIKHMNVLVHLSI